jgi:hypothetical protein
MEYITEEDINKIQEVFEEKVINEILDILRNDEKFQEFSKQTMNKIILGEI